MPASDVASSPPVALAVSMVWFEVALVIFLVVFLAIVAWVALARPGTFRHAAQIPLDDDTVVTPREPETDRGNDHVED